MCVRNNSGEIDRCIRKLVAALRSHLDFEILASCCGHDRYPLTLIVRRQSEPAASAFELMTGMTIPRKRNFYRKDASGFYYIPEVSKGKHG
jgi:hypothetical protein